MGCRKWVVKKDGVNIAPPSFFLIVVYRKNECFVSFLAFASMEVPSMYKIRVFHLLTDDQHDLCKYIGSVSFDLI